jgi:hypothetical protein
MGSAGGTESSGRSYGGPTRTQRNYQEEYLKPFFENKGTSESPYYGDLSRMYSNVINTPGVGQVAPEATKTINEMVSTGSPFSMSEIYKGAQPAYQRDLDKAIAYAKESAGATGGLRSSAGNEMIGKAAGDTTLDFNKYLMELAGQSWEAAQGRRMAAVPQSLEASKYPIQATSALNELATAITKGQYPWLSEAMGFGGAGTPVNLNTSDSFGFQGGILQGCCFNFLEAEGEVADSVREYRDEHYLGTKVGVGYKRMARWLVPIMRRSMMVKRMVRLLMTRPLRMYADWYYGLNDWGWIMIPFKWTWVTIWDGMGRTV